MIAALTRFGIPTTDLWYASRGTGLILLVLLSLSVAAGVAVRSAWAPGRTLRFVIEGIHKNVALIAVALLVVHVVTAELDPFVAIGWAAAIIPFVSPYRALWIGFGAISLDLFAAVVITSLLRRFMNLRTWKLVHFIAYASWPVAFAHSLEAGTDQSIPWVLGIMWGCAALVAVSVAVRLYAERPAGRWSRRAVDRLTPVPRTVTTPVRVEATRPVARR